MRADEALDRLEEAVDVLEGTIRRLDPFGEDSHLQDVVDALRAFKEALDADRPAPPADGTPLSRYISRLLSHGG